MRRSEVIAWLALAVAFSAVLVDLALNLRGAPEDRSTLVATLLLAFCLVCGRRAPAPATSAGARPFGLALVAAALLLELLGAAGDAWSIARLGLPAAVLGLALHLGRPAPAVAALSIWLVPIPDTAFELTTPGVEAAWARAASAVLSAGGLEVTAVGPLVRLPGAVLELGASDSGLHLAHVFSALGWYAAARAGRGALRAAGGAALGAALALPAQAASVTLAVALSAGIGPEAGGAWLTYGSWMLPAALVIGVVERARAGRSVA